MATMNVSLPDPMKNWVETQTKSGRYGNASDYVRDLIRRDQERQAAIAEIQTLVDEGLPSPRQATADAGCGCRGSKWHGRHRLRSRAFGRS